MKLEKLLERMDYKVLAGSTDIEISTQIGRASCRERVFGYV